MLETSSILDLRCGLCVVAVLSLLVPEDVVASQRTMFFGSVGRRNGPAEARASVPSTGRSRRTCAIEHFNHDFFHHLNDDKKLASARFLPPKCAYPASRTPPTALALYYRAAVVAYPKLHHPTTRKRLASRHICCGLHRSDSSGATRNRSALEMLPRVYGAVYRRIQSSW